MNLPKIESNFQTEVLPGAKEGKVIIHLSVNLVVVAIHYGFRDFPRFIENCFAKIFIAQPIKPGEMKGDGYHQEIDSRVADFPAKLQQFVNLLEFREKIVA
ncbi:MAG TPA: hypothetical protein VMD74_04945 [Candidatus Methylomirabilis sp.]|nr:hypothetical protein [Candidatus Methylomirabilis sp.]